MTRVNIAPVTELSDKFLLGEYHELPRVSGCVWRVYVKTVSLWPDGTVTWVYSTIPETYRMGKGHVTFFYDKGEFLRRRFEDEIVPEMQRRGFITNHTKYRMHPEGMNKDWTPDAQALAINRERLAEREDEIRKRRELKNQSKPSEVGTKLAI